MRKYQKAAVVMAMLGSVSFLGAGASYAGDKPEVEIANQQSTTCAQDNSQKGLINIGDLNLSVALLGLSEAKNEETNAVSCTSSFALGGK